MEVGVLGERVQQFLFRSYIALCLLSLLSAGDICTKIDSCSCKTSKGTISLKKYSSQTGPRFKAESSPYTYYYNPCLDFSLPCLATGKFVAAQENGQTCYSLGVDNSATFSGDPDAGDLTITYTSTDNPPRKSIFKLTCGNNELKFLNENPKITYNFELGIDILCKGGLSTGSILLIVVFVLLIVYLIAGIIFLKFVRRAEGMEMFPNYEFWSALPSLIRDGVYFTFRGCKTESTYEKI